jgi:hypothetical protein
VTKKKAAPKKVAKKKAAKKRTTKAAGARKGKKWSDLPAAKQAAATKKRALETARYFGAECQANPGSSFSEYASDIALRFGKGKKWSDLTKEEMAAARAAFSQGREEERALQGGSV